MSFTRPVTAAESNIPTLVMKDVHLFHRYSVTVMPFPERGYARLTFNTKSLADSSVASFDLSALDITGLWHYLFDAMQQGVFSLSTSIEVENACTNRISTSIARDENAACFVTARRVKFALQPDSLEYPAPVLRIQHNPETEIDFVHTYRVNEAGIGKLRDMLLNARNCLVNPSSPNAKSAAFGAELLWDTEDLNRNDGEDATFPSTYYIGEIVLLHLGSSQHVPMMVREVHFTPSKVRYSLISLDRYQTVSMIDSLLVSSINRLDKHPDLITDTARSYMNLTNVREIRKYLQTTQDRWY